MRLSKSKIRKIKRAERRKQSKINFSLKKRLYKDVVFYPCCYCKNVFMIEKLTVEHVIPLSMGGTNEDSNISLACAPCNHEKGKQSWFIKRAQDRERYEPVKEYYRQLKVFNDSYKQHTA